MSIAKFLYHCALKKPYVVKIKLRYIFLCFVYVQINRIGQKKPVNVYRLVCENTIEEKVVERAEMKLRLDAVVIQQGRLTDKSRLGGSEMLEMIRFGADLVFRSGGEGVTDEDIDLILQRGEERTNALNEKLAKTIDRGLLDFKIDGGIGTQGFNFFPPLLFLSSFSPLSLLKKMS